MTDYKVGDLIEVLEPYGFDVVTYDSDFSIVSLLSPGSIGVVTDVGSSVAEKVMKSSYWDGPSDFEPVLEVLIAGFIGWTEVRRMNDFCKIVQPS